MRFWKLIEPLRLGEYHFRKQVALGTFVVDFACHHAKIVVEIDGDTHFTDDAVKNDARRDAYLVERGFRVLRFTNFDVMSNPDGVYETLTSALTEGTPSLPSPQGGG